MVSNDRSSILVMMEREGWIFKEDVVEEDILEDVLDSLKTTALEVVKAIARRGVAQGKELV